MLDVPESDFPLQQSEPTPVIDTALYRLVMGSFLTGVTIITALDDDGPIGMAASSFTSLSMDPALVLFCAGKNSSSWPRIQRTGHYAVNILAADHQEISRQMSSKVPDKFDGLGWHAEATGAPVLDEALAWIDCSIEAEHEGGDHIIVVGRVLSLGARDGDPLGYFRGGYGNFTR
jgi:3-hydroxy-9,10-secoandrosta-1,3,5(10)-triene-9,17-dione monooxygenase reductase component